MIKGVLDQGLVSSEDQTHKQVQGQGKKPKSLLGLERQKPEEQLKRTEMRISLGLSITPLVEDSEIGESEPLLIHWAGHNPFEAFPNIGACPDGSIPRIPEDRIGGPSTLM